MHQDPKSAIQTGNTGELQIFISIGLTVSTNGIDPIPSARSPPRSDLPSPLGAPPAISITDSIADLMQVLL